MKIRLAALVTVCAAALLWYSEPIQSENLATKCIGSKHSRTDVIAACTTLINTSEIKDEDRQRLLARRSWVYYCDRQYDNALADADRFLSAQPENPSMLIKRGWYRNAAGNADGAAKDFEYAQNVGQHLAYVHFNTAKFHDGRSEYDLAAASYRKTLELNSTYDEAAKRLISLRYELKDYESVGKLVAEARARWPDKEWVYTYSLIDALLLDKDAEAALNLAKSFAEEFPESFKALYWLALIQFGTGDKEIGTKAVNAYADRVVEIEYAQMGLGKRLRQKFSNWLVIGQDLEWLLRAEFYSEVGEFALARQEMENFLESSGKNGRLFLLRLIRSKGIQVDQMAYKGSEAHLKQAISDYVVHKNEMTDLSVFKAVLNLPEVPTGL